MFWALVQDHPFRDGNKRYAIVATIVFLMMNGCLCFMSNDEWEVLALSVARHDILVEDVVAFFHDRLLHANDSPEPSGGWASAIATEVGVQAAEDIVRVARGLLEHVQRLEMKHD